MRAAEAPRTPQTRPKPKRQCGQLKLPERHKHKSESKLRQGSVACRLLERPAEKLQLFSCAEIGAGK